MKIDRSRAMHVCDRHPAIPKAKRAAHQLWKLAALAVFFGGPIYAFWGGWYWAVGGLALGGALLAAVRHTAAEFVAETAHKYPWFKEEMTATGVIVEE